jgi:hypothetical protein
MTLPGAVPRRPSSMRLSVEVAQPSRLAASARGSAGSSHDSRRLLSRYARRRLLTVGLVGPPVGTGRVLPLRRLAVTSAEYLLRSCTWYCTKYYRAMARHRAQSGLEDSQGVPTEHEPSPGLVGPVELAVIGSASPAIAAKARSGGVLGSVGAGPSLASTPSPVLQLGIRVSWRVVDMYNRGWRMDGIAVWIRRREGGFVATADRVRQVLELHGVVLRLPPDGLALVLGF